MVFFDLEEPIQTLKERRGFLDLEVAIMDDGVRMRSILPLEFVGMTPFGEVGVEVAFLTRRTGKMCALRPCCELLQAPVGGYDKISRPRQSMLLQQ